jgi:small subunit ribosomal protein S16
MYWLLLELLQKKTQIMVRIRLRRTGAKNNPAYRIVVADVRAPRDGDFIEILGHYLPTRQPHVIEINEEKAREWIRKGAQPSDTAASLLRQKGILNAQNKLSQPGDVVETAAPPVVAAPVQPVVAPTEVAPTEVAPTEVAPTEVAPIEAVATPFEIATAPLETAASSMEIANAPVETTDVAVETTEEPVETAV